MHSFADTEGRNDGKVLLPALNAGFEEAVWGREQFLGETNIPWLSFLVVVQNPFCQRHAPTAQCGSCHALGTPTLPCPAPLGCELAWQSEHRFFETFACFLQAFG